MLLICTTSQLFNFLLFIYYFKILSSWHYIVIISVNDLGIINLSFKLIFQRYFDKNYFYFDVKTILS